MLNDYRFVASTLSHQFSQWRFEGSYLSESNPRKLGVDVPRQRWPGFLRNLRKGVLLSTERCGTNEFGITAALIVRSDERAFCAEWPGRTLEEARRTRCE